MKRDYMAQISRAARWWLPPEESAEVIADYQEFVTEGEGSEAKLYHEIGRPIEAVRVLANQKEYVHWLLCFSAMTGCLLVYLPSALPNDEWCRFLGHADDIRAFLPLALGLALSIWFWRKATVRDTIPLGVKIGAVGTLSLCAVLGAYLVYLFRMAETGTAFPMWLYGRFHYPLRLICCMETGFGLYSLVMARMRNHHWRILYILSLTTVSIAAGSLLLFTSLNLEPGALWVPHARNYVLAATFGLTAAGIALRRGDSSC